MFSLSVIVRYLTRSSFDIPTNCLQIVRFVAQAHELRDSTELYRAQVLTLHERTLTVRKP